MTSKNRRGWNFRKGEKDAITTEEARARAAKGGKVKTSKGFADKSVQAKAAEARKSKKNP